MLVKQVIYAAEEAIKSKMYLAMRHQNGPALGYNPYLLKCKNINKGNPEKNSIFESFRYISFHEYISIKKPLFR